MRAISIRQPFASRIARGMKRWEHRTWRIACGPLLICASKEPQIDQLPCGVAICVVDVVAMKRTSRGWAWKVANVRAVVPFAVCGKAAIFHVADAAIRLN